MTEVQKRIMILMDEIHTICQKEDLHYVLINDTAARAGSKHAFGDSRYEFKLLMPMEDIAKLQIYVEANYSKNRDIESWYNNSALYQMVFRYVDKNSLLIDGPAGRYLKMPGISVTIYPARRGKPTDAVLGAERYLQYINNDVGSKWRESMFFLKFRAYKRKQKKSAIMYCTDHIFSGRLRYLFGGRDKLASWIMKHQNMQGAESSDQYYWYMKENGELVQLPEDMFRNVQWIDFEDRQVCVPAKAENYWVDKNALKCTNLTSNIRVICECDLPYEEYLKFIQEKGGTSMEQLMCHYRNYNSWLGRVYSPMKKKVHNTFSKARRSVDRIDVWYELREKREEIQEAYQKKDVEALKELLANYLEKTELHLKAKLGFYIDEELFRCATMVWESQGKMNYADKVYKLVPDLYKKESVEETLAQGQK